MRPDQTVEEGQQVRSSALISAFNVGFDLLLLMCAQSGKGREGDGGW